MPRPWLCCYSRKQVLRCRKFSGPDSHLCDLVVSVCPEDGAAERAASSLWQGRRRSAGRQQQRRGLARRQRALHGLVFCVIVLRSSQSAGAHVMPVERRARGWAPAGCPAPSRTACTFDSQAMPPPQLSEGHLLLPVAGQPAAAHVQTRLATESLLGGLLLQVCCRHCTGSRLGCGTLAAAGMAPSQGRAHAEGEQALRVLVIVGVRHVGVLRAGHSLLHSE